MIDNDLDKISSKSTDTQLTEVIETSIDVLPLEQIEQELVNKIIAAPTKQELQQQFDLFNINQSKKNALRIIKLNNLLNKVEDQAIERFEKRPDQVSNKELLDTMQVVAAQIDRAQKSVDSLSDTPAIQINHQKNEVNINVGTQLDRDSKEKVMDVISALLKQAQNVTSEKKVTEDSVIVVDAEVVADTDDPNIANNEDQINDDITPKGDE